MTVQDDCDEAGPVLGSGRLRRAWQRVAAAFGACLAVMVDGRNSPCLYFQF